MNKVEYYEHTQIITIYLDGNSMSRIEALNEAAKMILREVIRCEHGIDPGINR